MNPLKNPSISFHNSLQNIPCQFQIIFVAYAKLEVYASSFFGRVVRYIVGSDPAVGDYDLTVIKCSKNSVNSWAEFGNEPLGFYEEGMDKYWKHVVIVDNKICA